MEAAVAETRNPACPGPVVMAGLVVERVPSREKRAFLPARTVTVAPAWLPNLTEALAAFESSKKYIKLNQSSLDGIIGVLNDLTKSIGKFADASNSDAVNQPGEVVKSPLTYRQLLRMPIVQDFMFRHDCCHVRCSSNTDSPFKMRSDDVTADWPAYRLVFSFYGLLDSEYEALKAAMAEYGYFVESMICKTDNRNHLAGLIFVHETYKREYGETESQ